MPLHPQFLSARRKEVHDHIAALYSRHVCPAVRENAIHEASAELRRLDEIEGWVHGMRETAAETLKTNRRRFMDTEADRDVPRRVLPMLTTCDVVVFPGERRRGP